MESNPVTEKTISALKRADISSADVARIAAVIFKKHKRLEPEDASLCTSLLLEQLHAVPLQDSIYIDENSGRMVIRGRSVKDPMIQKRIVEQARQMQTNIARKLVREKVEYAAVVLGRKATSVSDLLFTKAALWFSQQEDEVYADIVKRAGFIPPGNQG